MLAIHTILHPTDFSDRSVYAFELACALARDYCARLIVLHVAVPVFFGEGLVATETNEAEQEAREHFREMDPPNLGERI